MGDPLVSVVIPVHNGMPYLRDAVASVLGQTYRNIELVVVENASNDGSTEWLTANAPSGARLVRQDQLVPAGRNWSDAIAAARGEWVKLLCADDLLYPESIAVQVREALVHPATVMVASRRDICDDQGRVLWHGRGLYGLEPINDRFAVARAICRAGTNVLGEPHAVLFRTEAVQGELPWNEKWPYAIDVEMYLRVLRHGSLATTDGSHSAFRLAAASWSARLAAKQADQFCSWFEMAALEDSLGVTGRDVARMRVRTRRLGRLRRVAYQVARASARLRPQRDPGT